MAWPFHVIVVLIVYPLRNSLSMLVQISNETNGLMLFLGLHVLQYIMHASSKGFGEVAKIAGLSKLSLLANAISTQIRFVGQNNIQNHDHGVFRKRRLL